MTARVDKTRAEAEVFHRGGFETSKTFTGALNIMY